MQNLKVHIGSNFRLYTFINFYLSPIQQGIQSAHIVSELFAKYSYSKDEEAFKEIVLHDWAKNHKTIIVLNSGTSFDIRQDYIKVSSLADKLALPRDYGQKPGKWFLPYTFFTEDFNALGAYDQGVVTGFGIILPEEIWNAQGTPEREIGWAVNYDPNRAHLDYFFHQVGEGGKVVASTQFWSGEEDTELISFLKGKSLAR